MTWLIRLAASLMTMLSFVIFIGLLSKRQVADASAEKHNHPIEHTNYHVPAQMVAPPANQEGHPAGVVLVRSTIYSDEKYKAIAQRNIFNLVPKPPAAPSRAILEAASKQDLAVTGLANISSKSFAMFSVMETGKSPLYFTLSEGEENEWLKVETVCPENATVTVFLKTPVMGIQNSSVEVVLSLKQ